MTDIRTLLTTVTAHPAAADPAGAVRRRIARRRARRVALTAGLGGVVAVAAVVAVAVRPDAAQRQELRPVSVPSASALPSGGSVTAATPADAGVDTQNVHLIALAAVVTAHPEAFVGTYVDDAGVAVVAFGPDADPAAWAGQLRDAAGPQSWRTTRCGFSRAELDRVHRELGSFAWPSGRPAYAADVDSATCSVRLRTDVLTPADLAALNERYGDRVTVDPAAHPTRR